MQWVHQQKVFTVHSVQNSHWGKAPTYQPTNRMCTWCSMKSSHWGKAFQRTNRMCTLHIVQSSQGEKIFNSPTYQVGTTNPPTECAHCALFTLEKNNNPPTNPYDIHVIFSHWRKAYQTCPKKVLPRSFAKTKHLVKQKMQLKNSLEEQQPLIVAGQEIRTQNC